MALIGNYSVLNKTAGSFITGPSIADTRANYNKANRMRRAFLSLPTYSSIPMGYEPPGSWLIAQKGGGLSSFTQIRGSATVSASPLNVRLSAADLTGDGTVASAALSQLIQMAADLNGQGLITDAELAAVSSLAAALSGVGTISSQLSALVPMDAALSGLGAIVANLKGSGRLGADITPFTDLSPENLAAAVWDKQLSDHQDVGTAGKALTDAGAAGNPWSAELTSNIDPGTFGEHVQKLLTKIFYLGSK